MNQRAEKNLIQKIRQLPPERLTQVEDFIEFLSAQERRREAIERIQGLRDRLPPEAITEGAVQEIVETVREVRAGMRTGRSRANRP